jgi:hypothetical protein
MASVGNSEFTAEFFDESSKAWMMNKKRVGASMVYRCTHITSSERQCFNKATLEDSIGSMRLCKIHINKVIKSIRKNGGQSVKNSVNGDAR